MFSVAYAVFASIVIGVLLFIVFKQRRALQFQAHVQEELRQAQERNRLLVDNIDVGITLTDHEHRVLTANKAMGKIFRQDPEAFIGRELLDLEDEDAEEETALVKEGRCIRSDGAPFIALKKAFPLHDEEGNITGFIEMVQDVTAQKQAEDERIESERQVQSFQKLESLGILAGGIAHDFNNLLMGILGNADLARITLPDNDPCQDYLTQIEESSRLAAELCKQMLAYSGKGRFFIEPLDMKSLLESMQHILKVSVSKNAMVRYHFEENLPMIEADTNQIRQVIMNLITNASDAIGRKEGMISVKVCTKDCTVVDLSEPYLDKDLPPGKYVCFEVADTGCGMDGATLERLFDPFYSTKFTGRGLGMAAVLGIIRGHRGAIKVTSEPEKGTLVRVLFPASQLVRKELILEEEVKPELDEGWMGSGVILVIDDEEHVRTLSKAMLERLGFEVFLAEDGIRGLNLFREFHDQITGVLLDLTMPRMDGEETLEHLREIDPKVRVLLSSGYSESEVSRRIQENAVAHFIQKPYQLKNLREKIRALVI